MTKDGVSPSVVDVSRAPTGLSSWGLVIARALRARGSDPAALFAQAGVDPAALADPDARIPVQATARVWRLAAAETRDPWGPFWCAGENRHEKVGERDGEAASKSRASPTPGGVHPWEAYFLRSAG